MRVLFTVGYPSRYEVLNTCAGIIFGTEMQTLLPMRSLHVDDHSLTPVSLPKGGSP